ncbi:hypothetical protein K7X08_008832 [Anisodus acutangulus]|uniref:Uncharacterized protein n=1 Tax=Anisodus acutangulus TaxID=402998 RepID=A0A9Q1MZJ8_9SOLA|nr:hypothetical protein K7X08_008832 [Anisodus acutangulus]
MTAASLETMLSFTPHYTPPGEYKEPPTMHVPRCPKQNIPRYGARGRGCQGEAGNRRGRGRVDHQLVDQDDVVADRKPDALAADMPSSSMPVIGPYYPVMNSDMPSSSMSHEVPHYQTTTIVTPDGSFRQFASSEPLSFTDLSQRFTSDLHAFARHSSPAGRRLSFTDSSMACDVGASHFPTPDLGALEPEDATETQVVVAQCRSKKEHRATSCSTCGHRY